jgi:hypothetical protein
VTRFVITVNNRGINCQTGCSVFCPHKVSSVLDADKVDRFIIKKDFNVSAVIINCNCIRDVK